MSREAKPRFREPVMCLHIMNDDVTNLGQKSAASASLTIKGFYGFYSRKIMHCMFFIVLFSILMALKK